MQKKMIVSDIGGTNGRFAVATFLEGERLPVIDRQQIFPTEDFQGLADMFGAYVDYLGADVPALAQLSVAGPCSPKMGHITNLKWSADAEKMERQYGLENIYLLNDFAALAYATLYLEEDDFISVTNHRTGLEGAPVTIMGPGTGLGVAMAIPTKSGWRVVPTEGGHMAFAAKTPLEQDLKQHLQKSISHVSNEVLISGGGLKRIHEFLVTYGGSGDVNLSPAQITAGAKEGVPSCVRAVQLFLSVLGSAAGDVALAQGAQGGIIFGGGILPKMQEFVASSDLVDRFSDKDKMAGYLNEVPIRIVASETSALLGAAMAVFDT